MHIVCADIYNPTPINCGGDWYRFQLFTQLSENYDFIELYTLDSTKKEGYVPNEIRFNTYWIEESIRWKKKGLQLLRPELIFPCLVKYKGPADVVFCTHYSFHIARTISRRCKAPLILITHNVEWKYWKANGHRILSPLVKAIEAYILLKCDAVITLSVKDAETFSIMTDPEKIFYVPPSPDRKTFCSDGAKVSFPQDKLNLLFYGSLDREHNVEALNIIFREIIPGLEAEGIFDKVRINIFGSGEPPKVLQENMSRVTFYGCVNNPAEFIRGADVIIAPLTNAGGVKIRIIESVCCGKKIIATREAVAGLPSDFVKYVTVVNSSEGFINAIKKITNDEVGTKPMKDCPINIPHTNCLDDAINYASSRYIARKLSFRDYHKLVNDKDGLIKRE